MGILTAKSAIRIKCDNYIIVLCAKYVRYPQYDQPNHPTHHTNMHNKWMRFSIGRMNKLLMNTASFVRLCKCRKYHIRIDATWKPNVHVLKVNELRIPGRCPFMHGIHSFHKVSDSMPPFYHLLSHDIVHLYHCRSIFATNVRWSLLYLQSILFCSSNSDKW